MKVSIWDLDFYHNKKGFNIECMKVSSYHKQKGDVVNFIKNEFDITIDFDIMYVTKRDLNIQAPPISLLVDERVRVWGPGFKYFTNYKLAPVIAATRPDYLLYPKDDKLSRSDIVQFFDYNNNRLKKVQEFKNTFKNKNTLVADESFWKAQKQDILYALEILKKLSNISFSDEIPLKLVIDDPEISAAFLQLQFSKEANLRWENNLGHEIETANRIISFMRTFKSKNKGAKIGKIPFEPILLAHKIEGNGYNDVERCMQIIDIGKTNGLELTVKMLTNRLSTPYVHVFETLSSWSNRGIKLSLYEFIVIPLVKRYNKKLQEIYMTPSTWADESFREMIRLIETFPELRVYATHRWKSKHLEITKIDWLLLKEHTQYI